MMRNWFDTMGLFTLGCAFFVSQTLSAEQMNRPQRVSIQQEVVSEETLLHIEELRMQEDQLYSQEEKDDQPMAKSLSYYPDFSLKFLEDMGFMGSSLILTDGTVWITKPSDAKKIMHWTDRKSQSGLYPAEVYLTSNNNWIFGRDYKYRIVNVQTGESALVNISNEPYRDAAFFVWNIDAHLGIVELYTTQGEYMSFEMSGWDKSIYSLWQLDQCIILGRNTRWNSSSNPYLLINLNNMTNVRAKLGR